ncbi:LysE family transporter [Kitasatospora sp. NPDC048365]|uniref:LysE family transporter n=1 Tax=Kitasatospora sp. NPDC048365 TaxID=3364050 RepID=UPI00371EFC5C
MTGSLMTTAAEGAAAGLGVAMPLGAIGVLLLQEGRRGWRPAASGAAAVAVVDGLYAAVAVLVGPQLARALAGYEGWVRLLSAALLAVIAVRGLLSLRGAAQSAQAGPGEAAGEGGAFRSFVRFGLLTLVNPMTALYFTALIAARGSGGSGGSGGAVYVAAVFAASLLWQELLAAAGALAGARLRPGVRRATYAAGYGLVACLAIRLAWPG